MAQTQKHPAFQKTEDDQIKNCISFNEKESRFYSKIPWSQNPKIIQSNMSIATKSHIALLKKASKDPESIALARESFQSMQDNGFLIKTSKLPFGSGNDGLQTDIITNKNIHVTPKTFVKKLSSTSTKLRVAWDASRTTTQNKFSLNDILLGGIPQYSLVKTLLNWRLKKVAVSTDISKFFNRIILHPQDRKYFNLLWTESMDPNDAPELFTLLVHTFGYKSTSKIAQLVVQLVADVAKQRQLMEVMSALIFSYVDDINHSLNTIEEALKFKRELKSILESHNLPPKGFAISFLKHDPELSDKEHVNVGAWRWQTQTDEMSLRPPQIYKGKKKKNADILPQNILPENSSPKQIQEFYKEEIITLETIVSRVAQLFDMTGLSSPIQVFGNYTSRLALQETKGDKNIPVSENIKAMFIKFLIMVSDFCTYKFKRNIGRADHTKKGILLAFSDASQYAYVVIFYLLRLDSLNKFFIEYLYSIAGLCPPSRSIPRNEIEGYSRASQTLDSIYEVIKDEVHSKALIGDSKVGFYWILNSAKKQSVFIQNRVKIISSVFSQDQLFYTPSALNPADIGTRPTLLPTLVKELKPGGKFNTGPEFLSAGFKEAVRQGSLIQMCSIPNQLEDELFQSVLDDKESQENYLDTNTMEITHQTQNQSDTVLLLSSSNEKFLAKVESVSEFSQYLINPLKRNYASFHLSMTIFFKAIHSFIPNNTKSKQILQVKENMFQLSRKEISNPTIDHNITATAHPNVEVLPSLIPDIRLLRKYKPHLATDKKSVSHLKSWINYPGLLKLVRTARSLNKLLQSPTTKQSLPLMIQLATTLKNNARPLATSQLGPISTSIAISELMHAATANQQFQTILDKLLNGEEQTTSNHQTSRPPILKSTPTLVTCPNSWPSRAPNSISKIFNTTSIRYFTRITEEYLNKKSTEEVKHFIAPRTLRKIAVEQNNLLLARNRALLPDQNLMKDTINPILRLNSSPLTIALVKHNHTLADAINQRPSSFSHRNWKSDQFLFSKFGIIHQGSLLFKHVQQKCLRCQKNHLKQFQVPQGPMDQSQLEPFRIFSYCAIDCKGPFTLQSREKTYALVAVCLQTRYTEIIPLQSKKAQHFLEGLNVIFTLYGSPQRLICDRDSAILPLIQSLEKLNQNLLIQHSLTIELIPALAHWRNGIVERKIRQIGEIMGPLSLETSGIDQVSLANTYRIIANYLNKTPYFLQFKHTTEQATQTNADYNMQLEILAPISFLNPFLKTKYQPITIKSINESQTEILKHLGLNEALYKDQILPRLVLTLDYKRLSNNSEISLNSMALIHPTGKPQRKFEKAILCKIVALKTGKDGFKRIAKVMYFRSKTSKTENGLLIAKPVYLVRAVETLFRINQEVLDPCPFDLHLQHQCNKAFKGNEEEPGKHEDFNENEETFNNISIEQLDPAEETIVWVTKDRSLLENIQTNTYHAPPNIEPNTPSQGQVKIITPDQALQGNDPLETDKTDSEEEQVPAPTNSKQHPIEQTLSEDEQEPILDYEGEPIPNHPITTPDTKDPLNPTQNHSEEEELNDPNYIPGQLKETPQSINKRVTRATRGITKPNPKYDQYTQ